MDQRSRTLRCHPLQRPMFRHRIVSGCNGVMEIPLDFLSRHMTGDCEGNNLTLTTDYSDRKWNVVMDNDHLTQGWEEFVDSHHLRSGDVVIFRKDGDLAFHVSFFGPTGCLIEYKQQEEAQIIVRIDKSSASEDPPTPIFQRTVTLANIKANQVYVPADFSNNNGLMNKNMEILLMNQDGSVHVAKLKQCKDSRQIIVGGWNEFCTQNNLTDGDVCSFRFVCASDMVAFQIFAVVDRFGNPKQLP